MTKDDILRTWANHLANAAHQGALTGRPCPVSRVETIAGPRAGILEIFAGLESGRLLRTLSKNSAAVLRQFIPWQFTGSPQVFMNGRHVRCEAGWPADLANSVIKLSDISDKPEGNGRWVAGVSETGATILPGLNDQTPHFLVSGATGSGKSVALQSAVLQLSQDPDNDIVLVDGKMGESLKSVERLPNVVAPCVVDGPDARNALGWAAREMKRRYQVGDHEGRLIVVIDEFQEFVDDAAIVNLLRKLVSQGRAASVHVLLATQHPTVKAFGDSAIRRNLVGKIALHVLDAEASRVAVGGPAPRADYLLGAGDSYTLKPGLYHRVQLAYVDDGDIGEIGHGTWRLGRYPEYDPEDAGQEMPQVNWSYTGDELAVSIVSAACGEGRPAMVNRLKQADLGTPGAERGIRLLKLGRDANDWLIGNGYAVCLSGGTPSHPQNQRLLPDVW